MTLFTEILDLSKLVLLAGAVSTAAMLFRNQIALRCVFIVGSLLYITYYFVAVSPPLIEAAVASSVIALATLYGLISLLLDRSRFLIRSDQIPLFEAMGEIEPGAFRRLMQNGRRRVTANDELLTRQGVTPDRMFFVVTGEVHAEKGRHRFRLSTPLFVGEVAYMTGVTASATVHVGANAELIEWKSATLRRATQRNPRLGLVLEARLARELAAKIRESVNPEAMLAQEVNGNASLRQ